MDLKEILLAKINFHLKGFPRQDNGSNAELRRRINQHFDNEWAKTGIQNEQYYPLSEFIKELFNILSIPLSSPEYFKIPEYFKSPITKTFLSHVRIQNKIEIKCNQAFIITRIKEEHPNCNFSNLLEEQKKLLATKDSIHRRELIAVLEKYQEAQEKFQSQDASLITKDRFLHVFSNETNRQAWREKSANAKFSPERFLSVQKEYLADFEKEIHYASEASIRKLLIDETEKYTEKNANKDCTYENFLNVIQTNNPQAVSLFEADFLREDWRAKILKVPIAYTPVQGERYSFIEHQEAGTMVSIEVFNPKDRNKKISVRGNIPLYKIKGTVNSLTLEFVENEKLSYGNAVAMGGDYYGKEVISDVEDLGARQQRFIESYNDMMKPGIQNERDEISKISTAGVSAINESFKLTNLLGPHYQELLMNNFDHFAPHAWKAYEAGHTLAIALALKAFSLRTERKNHVEADKCIYSAYLVNAFACHFLSDYFAGGHLRVPRRELVEQFGLELGGLLSHRMHDEDGDFGVVATNSRKNKWRLYGDGKYYISENIDNVSILHEAMQGSACEVNCAYLYGPRYPEYTKMEHKVGNTTFSFKVENLIPIAVDARVDVSQNYPLFRLPWEGESSEKVLKVRKSIKDRRCSEYETLTMNTVRIKFPSEYAQSFFVSPAAKAINFISSRPEGILDEPDVLEEGQEYGPGFSFGHCY